MGRPVAVEGGLITTTPHSCGLEACRGSTELENEQVLSSFGWESVAGLDSQQLEALRKVAARGVFWQHPSLPICKTYGLHYGGDVEADGNCLFTAVKKALQLDETPAEIRKNTVLRFMSEYEACGLPQKEEVDSMIKNLYSPNLSAGWGVHVVQELKLLAKKAERGALETEIEELMQVGMSSRFYEKLLQCDARLKALAINEHPELKLEELDDQLPENNDSPAKPLPKVKLEITGPQGSSPSSGMESRGSDDSDGEDTGAAPSTPQSQALVEVDPGVDQKPPRGVLVLTDNDVLNEIVQILLGETSGASRPSPERGMFRVSSMSGFFEDNWLPASYSVSDWNPADSNHGNEGYGSDDKNNNNNNNYNSSNLLFELDEKPFSGGSSSSSSPGISGATTGSTSLQESVKQCFTRHGSSGDLLVNLPRIASLPQLFENGVSRRDSHLSLLELL